MAAMPVSALQPVNRASINGYTGVASNPNAYWNAQKNFVTLPTFLTFTNQLQNKFLSVQKQPFPASVPLSEETDDTLRGLRASAVVNDGLDSFSYPVTVSDTCDCITFPDAVPDNGFTSVECGGDVYWGTFQVQFTGGSCFDLFFDPSDVYANCPSGGDLDAVTEYVLCEIDFTEGTDDVTTANDMDELTTTDTTDDSKKVATLRKDSTHSSKTHIHLTVHRLLAFALEAVLALQAPFIG